MKALRLSKRTVDVDLVPGEGELAGKAVAREFLTETFLQGKVPLKLSRNARKATKMYDQKNAVNGQLQAAYREKNKVLAQNALRLTRADIRIEQKRQNADHFNARYEKTLDQMISASNKAANALEDQVEDLIRQHGISLVLCEIAHQLKQCSQNVSGLQEKDALKHAAELVNKAELDCEVFNH